MIPDSSPSAPAPSNEWIRSHYGRVYRAAWVMTGDVWEAEDLAQETFVVAIDRWHRFEGRSSEGTWLFGILIRLRRRQARTLMRIRQKLQRYRQNRVCTGEASDPQVEFYQKQWRESVWADVAKLPPSQRDAVTLRYAEGLSYEEIASAVGCAPGTAKTRVHHGVKRLRLNHDLGQLASERPVVPKSQSNSRRTVQDSFC